MYTLSAVSSNFGSSEFRGYLSTAALGNIMAKYGWPSFGCIIRTRQTENKQVRISRLLENRAGGGPQRALETNYGNPRQMNTRMAILCLIFTYWQYHSLFDIFVLVYSIQCKEQTIGSGQSHPANNDATGKISPFTITSHTI